jgi:hypothetical protein
MVPFETQKRSGSEVIEKETIDTPLNPSRFAGITSREGVAAQVQLVM